MDRNIQKALRFDPNTGEPVPAVTDFSQLAQDLVDSARGQGIELTGPNGLLTGLPKQVLQTALEVEMADHLGYEKNQVAGRNGLNLRNGSSPKTLRTEVDEFTIRVPGDREGIFKPAIVATPSVA